jgi:hypothetical protein
MNGSQQATRSLRSRRREMYTPTFGSRGKKDRAAIVNPAPGITALVEQ